MAIFKSDAQGFLVGELIETNRDMLKAQAQGMGIWKAIRTDVKGIARALNVQVASTVRSSRPGARTPATRTTSGGNRTAGGNVVSGGRSSGSGQQRAATSSARGNARATVAVVTPQRAANGRFIAGQKQGGAAGDSPASSGSGGGAVMSRLSDTLGRLSASMHAADNLDPTLNAAKEVQEVVAPLGRGLFSLFGRSAERRKERWYQRIINAIKPGGNKASSGTTASGSGGVMGGLGDMAGGLSSMLKNAPSLLMMVFTRILGPVAALWGSFELGKWVGGKIYDWLAESGVLPKVFDAFDAIGDTVSKTWGKIASGADAVWTVMSDTFKKGVDSLLSLPDKVGQMMSSIDESIRKVPVIGAAYAKTVDTAKGVVESVKIDAKAGFKEGKTGDVGGKTPGLLQAVARDVGKVVGWVGGSKAENLALQTGANYAAGNIGGLGDAQTRALVASTALTESGGGKLGVVNNAGYMGRYQAGAGWLADAGLIKGGASSVRAAMKADGFSRESDWGQSGGMTTFLKDGKNWNGGMTYDKYLSSATTQDAAFKTNSDAAYNQLLKNGTINANTPPEQVAGLLKARHIAGMGGALAVARGGTGAVDANGTSALKYYNDVAKDANGFGAAFVNASVATPNIPPIPSASVPSSVPAKIAPAPELPAPPQQLNSSSDFSRGVVVNVPSQLGQNVGDRGIAHIVSGGLGVR